LPTIVTPIVPTRFPNESGEPNMDTALSYLISAGIIAFGVWIVVGTVTAGSPMAWTLVPIVVGSISLYQVVSGVKSA
jgi:hypothetical protein